MSEILKPVLDNQRSSNKKSKLFQGGNSP